jgi:hypothetical protein
MRFCVVGRRYWDEQTDPDSPRGTDFCDKSEEIRLDLGRITRVM